MNQSVFKVCSICGQEKTADNFYKYNQCKQCLNARQLAYYHANKDTIRSQAKIRYYKNIEKMRENGRKQACIYKEKNNLRSRTWHHGHKEYANANRRKHKRDNPEMFMLTKLRAKAKRHGYELVIVDYDITTEKVIARCGAICHICKQPIDTTIEKVCKHKVTIDHIIPLSKGGEHSWKNVAPAHLGCNSSKHTKMPLL